MRSASTLSQPLHYLSAYNKGKDDVNNFRPHSNPYMSEIELEKHDGYNDGFHDNYKGIYVEFAHEGGPIERRYFKTESGAISWALSFKGAQIRTK